VRAARAARRATSVRAARARLHDFVARHAFARTGQAAERVGAEIEFLAVRQSDGRVAPLDAADGSSVLAAVRDAAHRLGWFEGRSGKGAPWFALPSGGLVTFEPGGQVEYACRPCTSASELLDELSSVARTLRDACARRGVALLECGIDPNNGADDAPLQIDAPRYRRMDAHFARIGSAGARMMRQTASLQLAVDTGADAGGRWRLLNALVPVLTATFANSRRYGGGDSRFASYRAETWRRVDCSRTGIFASADPVREYVDFAMRAPAILLGTEGELAQPFGAWLAHGAGVGEWKDHLGTLFPEVRPRGYLEVRSIDAVPEGWWPAAVILVTGLAYDARAAREAGEILGQPDRALLQRAGEVGLADPWLRQAARDLGGVAVAGARRLGEAFIDDRHLSAAEEVLAAVTG
jgi:glutamate--cysteine ligase